MISKKLIAILASLTVAHSAQAVITYSGIQDISIPTSFNGIYIDFTDPNDATMFATSTTAPADWDLNFFFGGAAIGSTPDLLVASDTGLVNSNVENYPQTVIIGDGSGDGETFVSTFNGSTNHMGTGTNQFENNVEGYMGFQISDGSTGYYYGWMRVTLRDDGSPGTIHDWAWDTSGNPIQVGVFIPEPHVPVLTAFGLGFLMLRRRRKACE